MLVIFTCMRQEAVPIANLHGGVLTANVQCDPYKAYNDIRDVNMGFISFSCSDSLIER